MVKSGVPLGLPSYGINYITEIQNYYDSTYPGLYRIVVFDENPSLKPLWKSAERKRYTVPITSQKGSMPVTTSALTNIAKFFKISHTVWIVNAVTAQP
uniref:Uncharacterized protein n=1 Tax=Ditylenchus dipsaci TaxID=166011 RepID=A0A915E4Y6_9BILA